MRKITNFLYLLIAILWLNSMTVEAQKFELQSPNKEIKVTIDIKDSIFYSVLYNNELLLKNCYLQLGLLNQTLGLKPKLAGKTASQINETIRPEIAIKNAVIENKCNVLLLKFKNDYSVEFRAYNDGIAYRFITNKKGDISVVKEDFAINFPDNYLSHLQQTSSFRSSYEQSYTHVNTADFYKENLKMASLPVLLDTKKQYKILISEADLYDYPCMFMKGTSNNGMISIFPQCPLEFGEDGDRSLKITKEANYIAKTKGQRTFPWRVFVITKDDKQIIENQLVYKLSTPCKLTQINWIKPGQVTWEWWHDAALYGVDFKSGYNLDSYKYYIDFASKFGIPYIIMDEGWAKSTTDPYTPNPTIDLFQLIQYGKDKNVKIVLWLTWLTVEKNFDLFKKFSEWGIAGVKIDFMDRSDQWMVNFYERVAKEAAKYNMFVDFHGAFKPAGLERAYPNVLSYEGVLGMEQGGNCKPDNSVFLPFIRNAVGPMDYTPGSMNSAQPEDCRGTRTNPMGVGTRAYQMALYIAFETGLQMLADNPFYYYRERECTDFITSVPVIWDETKALYAVAGECLVVAKRKGDKWFIGAMANGKEKERTVEVDLSFLQDGKQYQVTAFEDGVNAGRQAMDYRKKEFTAVKGDKIKIRMVRNGGWAAFLK
ncbi:MAG: glycoside hydrolase family 97 protein [Bacteroidota bacterium]|nr:glycoside hydrolase family 97 protein [Bacteroidota bacterium]